MAQRRVTVVGAGIGGLATAIALRRAGVDVEIIERATELREIGAAISVWPNALAACDVIGVGDAIRSIGAPEMQGGVRAQDGHWIARVDHQLVGRYLGGPSVVLHRAELQRVLLDAASGIPLRLGAPCASAHQTPSDVEVTVADGEVLRTAAVIGCDGIWSQVRAGLGDRSKPAYSGLTGWRTVIENPGSVSEAWISAGHGHQFLVSPMSRGRLFLGAAVPMEEGRAASITDVSAFLQETFRAWHDPVRTLLDATPASSWIGTDFYHRAPPTWLARGRVALVGDAAHPMTPDLGQGGCQALEDAAVLGHCFSAGGEVGSLMERYETLRLRRVRSVVSASARIGRAMSTGGRLQTGIRNQSLRLTPNALRLRYVAGFAGRRSFERSLTP